MFALARRCLAAALNLTYLLGIKNLREELYIWRWTGCCRSFLLPKGSRSRQPGLAPIVQSHHLYIRTIRLIIIFHEPPPPPRVLLCENRAEFPFSYRHQLADFSPTSSGEVGAAVVVAEAAPLTPAAAAAAAADMPCPLHDGVRPERDAFFLCVFEHLCR